MEIKVEVWSLKKLIENKSKINPKPQYQRTSVWAPNKKRLLIDSILRGYDIPKFYLRKTPTDALYEYEVTDGQQRIRSIWEFAESSFKLDASLIDELDTKGLDFEALKSNKIIYAKFLNYEINIAVIKEATQDEIRTLFARLQMGDKLNPAELRHAMASNLGNAVISITENHQFFEADCKIPNVRYKHQDYLDNAITLCNYDGTKNIKAVDIKSLYMELSKSTLAEMQPLLLKVNKVLDYMQKINSYKKGIFKNKWAFVDMFYLLYKNIDSIREIKPKNLSENFIEFEGLRKKNNSNPEKLIDDKQSISYDKDLYDYIIAFKTSGADKGNAKIRYRVFYNKFLNKSNFEFNKA